MRLILARCRVVMRAMRPGSTLERLVVLRGILRRASFGAYRNTDHAARLDARVLEALHSFFSAPYRDWLDRYQPEAAANDAHVPVPLPVSVVLHPGLSALRLARCLRALRQQDRPCRNAVVLAMTPGRRLAARTGVWLAGEPELPIVRQPHDLATRLEADVLLLKGAPLLRPRALGVLAAALAARPAAMAVYADEDRLGPTGVSLPFLKPDHSPVLGRQYDHVGGVALFRRDFFLRAVLPDLPGTGLPGWIGDPGTTREHVVHLPDVLYTEPTRRRLSHLAGAAFDAELAAAARKQPLLPRVAVVIPSKDRAALLQDCIESIFDLTDYDRDRLSVIVVDNGSTEAAAVRLLQRLEDDPAVTVLRRPSGFNYAWLCNQGAAATTAPLLVFMNNDIVVRDRDWVAKLVGATALPSVGVVGCKLLYPSGRVQHAGVVVGIQGLAGHIGVGVREHDGVYFDLANHTREVSAVTGALVAVRAELFHQAGGYDERLAVAFNDTALCLACNKLGRQTLCLQSALAYHVESASRGHDDHDAAKRIRLLAECQHVLSGHSGFKLDPFYNPGLSLGHAYELAWPPRHVVRPAPSSGKGLRLLMLSSTFQVGHGVAVVAEVLARQLQEDGCTVFIGAPKAPHELPWLPGQRFDVLDPVTAAQLAADLDVDVVMAHTPPCYGVFRTLPTHIAGIAYDYGEPPPDLFPDALERRLVLGDKHLSMRYADALLAISDAVRDENPLPGCGLLPLGNTHLARWGEGSAERRLAARRMRGWTGQLVILNVCRFHEGERSYKGIDFYANLRRALDLLHPEVAAATRFVLAGKGDRHDADAVGARGIDVVANPSDDGLADLYHACDLYMSFSRWEGYNLGVGQALALGLPVVASDIPAHRTFGVPVVDRLAEALEAVLRAFHDPGRTEPAGERHPRLWDWTSSASQLRQVMEQLVARKQPGASPFDDRGATPFSGLPSRSGLPATRNLRNRGGGRDRRQALRAGRHRDQAPTR